MNDLRFVRDGFDKDFIHVYEEQVFSGSKATLLYASTVHYDQLESLFGEYTALACQHSSDFYRSDIIEILRANGEVDFDTPAPLYDESHVDCLKDM